LYGTSGSFSVIEDGALIHSSSALTWEPGNDHNIGSRSASAGGQTPLDGWIGEVIAYNRDLTTAERQRLERYLAARWGITLAPQVSNADAQDWVNRVYANGGTVSSSTAAAVNTLCDSLDAASLRDRFYRLNLFCGTGLNAALVPLYRGPSLGGTQYGNTTDTNNAFVGVGTDYAETGAGGGLLGNGTSKYLNTGLTVSNIGTASSGHMSAYHGLSSGVNANRYYLGANDASTSNRFYLGTDSFSSATVFGSYGATQNATQSLAANGHGPAGHRILSRETDSSLTHYHNGSVVATNTTPITPAVSTAAFAVFAANRNGTVDRFHNSWIAAYSIGLGFNSAQAAAYRDIMQTFQTALGRNV
jgi:heme/copper-type cytochrome/quinol oxidase subunit 3